MEILTDNYIWIIVIIVVILMTIIGYIAEKTNFGKKEFSKKKESKKETEKEMVKPEVKMPVEPKPSTEPKVSKIETPEVEMTAETFQMPEEPVKVEKAEEDVHFTDPLADDMNVSSDTLETPYKEGEEILSVEEDLNAPFGETSMDTTANSFDIPEDLNAPFGDFGMPNENSVSVEENLNTPLEEVSYNDVPNDTFSYNMPEEDLNVPFGDNAEVKTRQEFNLNLPDIDSIKEDIDTTVNNDSDDDIWKF